MAFLMVDIKILIDKVNMYMQVFFMLVWLLSLTKKPCYSNCEIISS